MTTGRRGDSSQEEVSVSVPRSLTIDQKRLRINISNALLALLRHNKSEFWRRLIGVAETWIQNKTTTTKQTTKTKLQPKQWTAKKEPAPKKAKTVFSTGKVMVTVFWDSHGVILIDYLQKGKTITGAYYASLLHELKPQIAGKRPHL